MGQDHYDITPLGRFLNEAQVNGSGETVLLISKKLRGNTYTELIEVLRGYEDMFIRFARGIREHGRLEERDYSELAKAVEGIQKDVLNATGIALPIKKLDGQGRDFLRALHLLGGLEVNLNKGSAALFLSPRLLTQAFNIACLFEAPSRTKHIMAIASVRGLPMKLEEAELLEQQYVEPFVASLRNLFQRIALHKIPNAWGTSILEHLSVEVLPTATDFYEAGIGYYGSRIGRGRPHYIFATTSGILLPQDYYGSSYYEKILKIPTLASGSDKNPKREEYFRALANVRGRPRWYFFEIERASKAFKETVKVLEDSSGNHAADQYRNDSRKTIARFLQLPRFGLIGVNRFPREYDHLTLGNGRHVFLSGRDEGSGRCKIGHGLWLRPRLTGFGTFLKAFKELTPREWLTTLTVSAGMYSVGEDPRVRLLEALLSGFAIPFIFAGLRFVPRKQALDSFLDLANNVSRTLGSVDFPFYWHPEHKPLSEADALKEAQKVVSALEGV